MIQGPGVIDTSRTGKAEAAAYFLFTELIFVAFAMALFFTGVACLRKRTNDYLLRQFNQYILSSSGTPAGPSGSATLGNIPPGQDTYDFEYFDGSHPAGGNGSPSRAHHHHLHHNLHHGGFHAYRHHRSNGSLLEEGDFGSGDLAGNFNGAGPIHYPAHYGNSSSSSRYARSKPPPYHIALYLPLPEGMGGASSPTDDGTTITNLEQQDGKSINKSSGASDGIDFIDSSSIKDAQDVTGGNNVVYCPTENSSRNVGDSNQRNSDVGDSAEQQQQRNRSETPPPPYEQLKKV